MIIVVKDSKLEDLNKKHKSLQEKYLKLSSEKRMKPQEDLLHSAKEMKISRMDKELFSHQNNKYHHDSNYSNNATAHSKKSDVMNVKKKYSNNDALPMINQANSNERTMMRSNNYKLHKENIDIDDEDNLVKCNHDEYEDYDDEK